ARAARDGFQIPGRRRQRVQFHRMGRSKERDRRHAAHSSQMQRAAVVPEYHITTRNLSLQVLREQCSAARLRAHTPQLAHEHTLSELDWRFVKASDLPWKPTLTEVST